MIKFLILGLIPAIQLLHQRNVREDCLKREWESVTRGFRCPAQTRAAARAKTLVDRLRESWQHLLRDRVTRSLSYNDEQFHVLERIKVEETGRRIRALLERECAPAVANLADNLADWYKMAQTVYLQMMILDKDVDTYEKTLDHFIERLNVLKPLAEDTLRSTIDCLRLDLLRPKKNAMSKNNGAQIFRNNLKSISSIHDEIATIALQNSDLIGEFNNYLNLVVIDKNDSDS